MKLFSDQLLGRLLVVGAFAVGSQLVPVRMFAESVDTSSITGSIAPQETGQGSVMNFQADLFSGRFTYRVPIVIAPGRQGAQPSLGLGYNSGGGNGWCGVGWGLEVGFIQRDVRKGVPVQWSPNSPTPLNQYDDSQGFVGGLGGANSTLVLVGATNLNPVVYRQQVDTLFLTYNYYTNNHWEVVDKGGNIFYFGEAATNRMESTRTNWPAGVKGSTFRWALDRAIDANGNQTFFTYTNDGGTLYLTKISYNANTNLPALDATHTVDFILGDRPDTNFTFISGYRVTTAKRLAEIQVKANGSNVRRYSLNYSNSPSTLRSLLASVTEYGSDYSTSLPPITFNYQVKPAAFESTTNEWPTLYSQGVTDAWANGIRSVDSNGGGCTRLDMIDMDGDGLPDRVMRDNSNPQTHYAVQRNTGSGFAPAVSNFFWGPIEDQGNGNHATWNAVTGVDVSGATVVDTFDINGDGYADRIVEPQPGPYTNFFVQLNPGLPGENILPNPSTVWGPVTNDSTSQDWRSIRFGVGKVDMIDMNGDGLPDHVNRSVDHPLDRFRVQLNTGNGFSRSVDWYPLDSQNNVGDTGWNSISCSDGNSNMKLIMADINGDGLPDRVMRKDNTPYTCFVVQFNNGAGFELAENWGGTLDNQGQGTGSEHWCSPIGGNGTVEVSLLDINGDGLPDRVMRSAPSPYTNGFVVQLNTGSGFAPSITWGPLKSQGKTVADWNIVSGKSDGDTYLDMFDINGDGLPDRVMRRTDAPYDRLVVQLNKGPFPDLLSSISNNLGGSVQVTYIPSTTLNNRDKDWTGDPLTAGAKCLLPFNVWVISQVQIFDGLGSTSTNTYAFIGGYYTVADREFRGFSQASVTDALGTRTTEYFHQGGGRDNSALGEYQDTNSVAKKGMPFRIEVVGNDGATNRITLNKVDELKLHSNGWYYPFISQTIVMNYEGLSTYRATADQFTYDGTNGNLLVTANLGEVASVVVQGQTFTDVGNDSVYTLTTFASNLGNILNRPSDIKVAGDSAGSVRLREKQLSYDSHGNLTNTAVWLDSAGAFVTEESTSYDVYGNPVQSRDAVGITTTTTYESTYQQYPVSQVTGTFTTQSTSDIRSGMVLTSTDPNGLVTSNALDVFYRTTASYMSTNATDGPTLWKARFDYSLRGISNGVSYNYIHKQVNDAVDTANGFETYGYLDGLSRPIQSRVEAETGQFRVTTIVYDRRGNPSFQSLSYLGSGITYTIPSGTNLGAMTEYDGVGRAFRSTPAVVGVFDASGQLQSMTPTGGDTGSPVAPATTAFVDGSNPWATVTTDAQGKVRKSIQDAYGRSVTNTEVTAGGNYNTTYRYDLLGNATNVTDNAGNSTVMSFDSLGRKISMTDPDMGAWTYTYDNASRITQQIDARGSKLKFYYSDEQGRLSSKEIYASGGALVGTITFTYDSSDDPAFTVFKGQLYKTTDLQGYQKNSYDIRSRVIKTSRYLNVNSIEYVTQSTYDDADHLKQVTYPGNAATLRYSYDTAGNVSQVKSLAGTGTQEIFFTPQAYNQIGQLLSYTNGNGVLTTNIYYPNSKRLQRVQVLSGATSLQDLAYTYDNSSNLKSVSDGVYVGAASASLTNITYDDLYRLTSLDSTARGTRAYAYNSIGNVVTNQDFGSGAYAYGARPHAVTSANGTNYTYDACGNMTGRGTQTLSYNEQNELIQVTGPGSSVLFGYAESGTRLWRSGTNGYSVWIGGIYEINNGKVLCHVMVGSHRICSFEPQCGGTWTKLIPEERWAVASASIQSVLNWPFQQGRAPLSFLLLIFGGTLGVCVAARRRTALPRYALRRDWRPTGLWKQSVTFVSLTALIVGMTETRVEAVTYDPVFYYYHADNLGSSNVLSDRTGQRVQHYEYSSFGQSTYKDNSSAYQVSNRFTGQILDDETGLYYYGARYYDPLLGRFIQPDSMVQAADNPQTLNRYSYCANNPLNRTDPSGHLFFLIPILILVIEAAAVGAALSAAIAALNHQDPLAAAADGALTGALTELGGIAGAIVAAAIKHQKLGEAALLACVSAAIGYCSNQICYEAIGEQVSNMTEFVEYAGIKATTGAIGGAAKAAIKGEDVREGALDGLESGAMDAASKLGGAVGLYLGLKIGGSMRWVRNIADHFGAEVNWKSAFDYNIHFKNIEFEEALGKFIIPKFLRQKGPGWGDATKMLEKVGVGLLKYEGKHYLKKIERWGKQVVGQGGKPSPSKTAASSLGTYDPGDHNKARSDSYQSVGASLQVDFGGN